MKVLGINKIKMMYFKYQISANSHGVVKVTGSIGRKFDNTKFNWRVSEYLSYI